MGTDESVLPYKTNEGLFLGDHYRGCTGERYVCIASTSCEAVLRVVNYGTCNTFVHFIFQRSQGVWTDREDANFWLTEHLNADGK